MADLPLALTAGEPAGIGPDLCVQLLQSPPEGRLVIVADCEVLAARAAQLGLPFAAPDYLPGSEAPVSILHLPTHATVRAGQLDPANGAYVLASLRRAVTGCLADEFAGMVTGPVHKGVINEAGMPFTGHTEFLAELTATPRVVMMLAGSGMERPPRFAAPQGGATPALGLPGGVLRVALVTTHLPVKDIAAAITTEAVEATLRILAASLRRDFGLARPRILVAGLNPHAGEGGHLGREEIEIIEPVLARLRGEGMDLIGPLPADTLFQRKYLDHADAVLAMYHDQGLPVLKHASFGEGVNITLGLPIVRTSVDHGTALDLAGTGKADAGSLRVAIATARQMARNRTAA